MADRTAAPSERARSAAPATVDELVLGPGGVVSLDGEWEFFPGLDGGLERLDGHEPETILVPGLWEAQGHEELDGVSWYRRRFRLSDVSGQWTLRFGAVMDLAEVYLNDQLLGHNESAFTPFEVDPTGALTAGENVLAVRVVDPALGDPDHLLLAHGKQGWAHPLFPSPPSVYLTYGGIWQPVVLRRHGDVRIDDVFVNADPDDLVVSAELSSRHAGPVDVRLAVRTLGLVHEEVVVVGRGAPAVVRIPLGATDAGRWSPERPVLHEALVDVTIDGTLVDERRVRYGLRTVRLDGPRVLLNDIPYRMKGALVQGFYPRTLYAEPSAAEIRAEVEAAAAMGFNTLRLHARAFDPVYLDVCDELGMLLHCDLPVAEPVDDGHAGADTVLARRSIAAARAQIRRDRNHPSVIVWSIVNEASRHEPSLRRSRQHETFVRTLVATVDAWDDTRPVIENDSLEPDPDTTSLAPILTAHWYGRLHLPYLRELDRRLHESAGTGRPFFVSAFGDWGLPEMEPRADVPFWDPSASYASAVAGTPWPGTLNGFFRATQRYQGLSNRLQIELFRRHDSVCGYCLTELTDVPHELNGLLDMERAPKTAAAEELALANQVLLPMLELPRFTWATGSTLRAPLHIANDGGARPDAQVRVTLGAASQRLDVGAVPEHAALRAGEVEIAVPAVPGTHELELEICVDDEVVAVNGYPVHVVAAAPADGPVRLLGAGPTAAALERLAARAGDGGPSVVAEDALDAEVGGGVRDRLAAGETVLLLAQGPDAVPHFPVPVELQELGTGWGPSVFDFTTDDGGLPSLPRRSLLVHENVSMKAAHLVSRIDERPWPDRTIVGAFRPPPDRCLGAVVAEHAVGAGRLVLCQFRLAEGAAEGDPAALAVLADLLRLAARPATALLIEPERKADGRAITYYGFRDGS